HRCFRATLLPFAKSRESSFHIAPPTTWRVHRADRSHGLPEGRPCWPGMSKNLASQFCDFLSRAKIDKAVEFVCEPIRRSFLVGTRSLCHALHGRNFSGSREANSRSTRQ